jgi:hypothetical protein
MATKGNRLPAGRGILYQHTPNVIDEFGPEDAHTSYYPLPGIDFHNNPQLAQWVQKFGQAPDALFRQGLAAPPLGKNASGLRHYAVDFTGDPNMVVNLDVPLASQTRDVQAALERMGIKSDEAWLGDPMRVDELLWQRATDLAGPRRAEGLPPEMLMNPADVEDIARRIAAGDPELDAARNYLAGPLLEMLIEGGIPASSRRGTGWGAGTAFGPSTIGNPTKLLRDEIDLARAEGDVLRAQQLEDQLSEGDAGKSGIVPAPTANTREYKVFNPRFVDIKKVASLLGAMGVGGAASTAQAAEPGAMGEAGPMGLSPQAWGAAPPLVDSPQFTAETNPQGFQRFNQAFEQAMRQPVVRLNSGATITPDEFLSRLAESAGLSEMSVMNARNRMAGLDYDPNDEGADELRLVLLETLRDRVPGRNNPQGFSAGADPRQQFALKDRYSLTPEGEQGYQSERVYNLLTTFEDGAFTPPYADTASAVLSGLGTPFAPYFQAAAGDAAGAGDTLNLYANAMGNTPASRAASSLYWWDRGIPDGTSGDAMTGAKYPSLSTTTLEGISNKLSNADNYLPYFAQQLSEGRVYNPDLTMREFGLDVSSPQAWGAAPPMTGPTPSIPLPPRDEYYGRENALIQDLRNKLYRTTPQYPAGVDPAEMAQLTRDLRDFDMMNRGFANAQYPVMLKSMGMEPRFMTPAEEMVANAPRDMADGTFFIGAPFKAAKGISTLAKSASHADFARTATKQAVGGAGYLANEIKNEMPVNFAMQLSNQRGNDALPADEEAYNFAFKPMDRSIVTMPDGTPARPDDRYYESHWLPDAYKKRENMLQSLLDRGTNLYKPAVTAPSRASMLSGGGQ